VNIGSLNSRIAAPFFGPYCASKHALKAINDSLRMELRNWDISVSLVEPGNIDTPIWSKTQGTHEQLLADVDPVAVQRYADDIEALRNAAHHLAETGMPVKHVARAVRHALMAPRPKPHYPVGGMTRLTMLLAARIPARWMDRLICRSLGLRWRKKQDAE
jgi:short-subunit dehydrogenase